MSQVPFRSPIHFEHQPDGSITASVAGLTERHLTIYTPEQQAQADQLIADWERRMQLPLFQEDWDAWAQPGGWSNRYLRFILLDSGATRVLGPDGPLTFRPDQVALPTPAVPLVLGHRQFLIGQCESFLLVHPEFRETFALCGIVIPDETEGPCLVVTARLYQSKLAEQAWAGIRWNVSQHVCAVIGLPDIPTTFDGILIEVSLVGEWAGNPRATILSTWETQGD